ncbi:MAG: envelope stress response membrane protein PspB [Xanthomonadales bacterium]|nr:envelope stress response membrane protein PspB [Gammaproteobacteria bacterium]MBT8050030.1 envelope stress response membrane protein PspB [Gammaproteobacteria bacterium]MBT8056051.1 envelope stress response membrane protein PspB [Gammaproteobacteria bacterium]NNJ79039.1 envelope stress response membrane protein PspB [Xanthomonadales bacterium]NNL03803.1 envelope stress response membrane protein PspB [Xanthomonadales bacterium]
MDMVPILFLTIILPLWIVLHYITKWKSSKGLSNEDEKMLSEIWESANRMEERINTLERILDVDSPDWRRRA